MIFVFYRNWIPHSPSRMLAPNRDCQLLPLAWTYSNYPISRIKRHSKPNCSTPLNQMQDLSSVEVYIASESGIMGNLAKKRPSYCEKVLKKVKLTFKNCYLLVNVWKLWSVFDIRIPRVINEQIRHHVSKKLYVRIWIFVVTIKRCLVTLSQTWKKQLRSWHVI